MDAAIQGDSAQHIITAIRSKFVFKCYDPRWNIGQLVILF